MGEFKILLIAGNNAANNEFIHTATAKWGGATVGPVATGYWRNPATGEIVTDKVLPVYVATDDTAGVVRLVSQYRLDCKEDCVYLKYPNGMVSLIGN